MFVKQVVCFFKQPNSKSVIAILQPSILKCCPKTQALVRLRMASSEKTSF